MGAVSARPDSVSLTWLVTVRWTVLAAASGALVAGRTGLGMSLSGFTATVVFALQAVSNLWLMWRLRTGRTDTAVRAAGPLVAADVVLLTWILWRSGGVLNPASVFFLVLIVLAALVLGRTWTWIVTVLTLAGYGALYLTPSDELAAAQVMHPEIAVHMGGMWLAFAGTALVIAALVTALVIAIERRDRALAVLGDQHARSSRFASLATLAAGAAHELSTPLATMAVAARELERSLAVNPSNAPLREDAQLIRREIERCRHILGDLAAERGGVPGDAPRDVTISDVLASAIGRLPSDLAARITVSAPDMSVRWPVQAVARALHNVVHNALQASHESQPVSLVAQRAGPARASIIVKDDGTGMSAEELARAGEPFFTTRAPGVGTGLGLFVARSTAEQVGGTLAIVSARGQGTTVTLTLPLDVVTPLHDD